MNEPSKEPKNKKAYKRQFNEFYSSFANTYDFLIKIFPLWKIWVRKAIPFVQGPRVLEISFGTGYLLTQYANKFETWAIDYNEAMAFVAKGNLLDKETFAQIQIGDVENLPYRDESFNTIVNTMAFSSYSDGIKALSEMSRVLGRGGRIVMIDFGYPANGNRIGNSIIHYLEKFEREFGLVIRHMNPLFDKFNFNYSEREIGGFGSVHLYIAEKGYPE